jgi:hypothetical protein
MIIYDGTVTTQDAPANAASVAMEHLLLVAGVVKEIAHLAEIRTHDGLALGARARALSTHGQYTKNRSKVSEIHASFT